MVLQTWLATHVAEGASTAVECRLVWPLSGPFLGQVGLFVFNDGSIDKIENAAHLPLSLNRVILINENDLLPTMLLFQIEEVDMFDAEQCSFRAKQPNYPKCTGTKSRSHAGSLTLPASRCDPPTSSVTNLQTPQA